MTDEQIVSGIVIGFIVFGLSAGAMLAGALNIADLITVVLKANGSF